MLLISEASRLAFSVLLVRLRPSCERMLGKCTGQGAWAVLSALACHGVCPSATLLSHRMYLSVGVRKSTPPQNRQLVVLIGKSQQ